MASRYSLRGPVTKKAWSPPGNQKRSARQPPQQPPQQDPYMTQSSGQVSYVPIPPNQSTMVQSNGTVPSVQQNGYNYSTPGTSGPSSGGYNFQGTSSGTNLASGSYQYPNGNLNPYEQHIRHPDTSRIREILEQEESDYEPIAMKPKPAKPPADFQEDYSSDSPSEHDPSPAPVYTPKTKARKYNLHNKTEKSDPAYQLKRARNNDAVRKSRMKSKAAEDKRKKETEEMRLKIVRLEKELEMEKKARVNDKELIEQLLKERRQAPPQQSAKSCQPGTSSSTRLPGNFYNQQGLSMNRNG
ncbi:hypothetical protein CAEBREN_08060 [Caenorhabditis brenneri]|uniref:BZIP domain-containing protein n=1 Tax=Caenorhabditis brenneri TaxID=135651 RepID=G0NPE2_CAEBE|nr:hypothetical protein CAEBREN_08060 [Caenorhabditis brenneri]